MDHSIAEVDSWTYTNASLFLVVNNEYAMPVFDNGSAWRVTPEAVFTDRLYVTVINKADYFSKNDMSIRNKFNLSEHDSLFGIGLSFVGSGTFKAIDNGITKEFNLFDPEVQYVDYANNQIITTIGSFNITNPRILFAKTPGVQMIVLRRKLVHAFGKSIFKTVGDDKFFIKKIEANKPYLARKEGLPHLLQILNAKLVREESFLYRLAPNAQTAALSN